MNILNTLNTRGRIALLCLLLLLTLGLLTFTAVQTFQQVRSFQQHSRAVRAGDVHTIRPWMTVHTVSHIYRVPEGYLYQKLAIHNSNSMHHATLDTIAKTTHKPINNVIQVVQHAILAYRKAHPHTSPPPQTMHINGNLSLQNRRREA
ncbi:MAG: hypothetical protein PVS3B3_09270 [Ktedonobacteraceae bacterium]